MQLYVFEPLAGWLAGCEKAVIVSHPCTWEVTSCVGAKSVVSARKRHLPWRVEAAHQ